MPSSDTYFSKDNVPPKRGKSYQTLVLDAIADHIGIKRGSDGNHTRVGKRKAQEAYFLEMVTRGFDRDDKDSCTLLKVIGDKGWANKKPVHEKYEFNFPENATPAEQAEAIKKAVASGDIPMDIGQGMLTMIKDAIQIKENTELEQRIRELEEANGLG